MRVKSPGSRAGGAAGAGLGAAEDADDPLWNMRVNSPGAEDAGGGAGAGDEGAAGALTELNIRVNAPGSAGCSEAGCDAGAEDGAEAAGSAGGFCMGTWLKTWETPEEGLGGFCSIEVRVWSMRVNSPAADLGAGGGGGAGVETDGGAAAGWVGFSLAGAGGADCVRSEARRSSSLATGSEETWPKMPVALEDSAAGGGSAPRNWD